MKALLDELGIAGYPKTTGNRGIHVYVRLERRLGLLRGARRRGGGGPRARAPPARPRSPRRGGRRSAGERVFIDFNQNAPHKTVFGAWSVRARPVAQVSTPFALGRARRPSIPTTSPSPPCPSAWPRRATRGPTWTTHPQSLEPLLELYERDLAAGLMDAPWPPVYPKMPDEPPRVAPSRAKRPE